MQIVLLSCSRLPVSEGMKADREEQFGPEVPVATFDDIARLPNQLLTETPSCKAGYRCARPTFRIITFGLQRAARP